jgi:hypothetical protein
MFPLFNMLSLLFNFNLWNSVYANTITGEPCPVTNATGTQLTGICVPFDNNGLSEPCNGIYGFMVPDVCLQQYSQTFQNVHLFLFQISLILKRMIVACKSHVRTKPRAKVVTASQLVDIVRSGTS